MAEPTMKDVLAAIAKLTDRVERDAATKADLAKLATKADIDTLRAEMNQRFDELAS
ncbi:MAG: hypothetical protein KF795_02390 [Labilithrix sp.]|nr:hypothetical protein [Labilithrix sp.]